MSFEQLTDRRKFFKNTLTLHDQLLFHYVPLIGGNAFYLYLIYCSLAEKYTTVFPSMKSLRQQTGFAFDSIIKYNRCLEEVGLLEIKRNNLNNSNHYILTDPPELSSELKKKMKLHHDFKPIIEVFPVLQNLERRYSKNWSTGTPKSGTPVLQKLEHNNKDLVVVSNKTTTMQTALFTLASLFATILELPKQTEELIESSESILKSALKHKNNPEEAILFIQEKCELFKNKISQADDKLALIHSIVKKNWQDTKGIKHKAVKIINLENQKMEEQIQTKIMNEWKKLPPEIRVNYLTTPIKNYYQAMKKPLNEKELSNALATLIATGSFGNFNLNVPPHDFKGEI
jgi:hypothetical protein